MGYYLNKMPNGDPLPRYGKVAALLTIPGALVIKNPKELMKDMVCVVQTEGHEAALWIDIQRVFEIASDNSHDDRPKTWMIVPAANTLVCKYQDIVTKSNN